MSAVMSIAVPPGELSAPAEGGEVPHPLDEALEPNDDDEQDDEDEDDEDASDSHSYTSASALEEEALYADQPACGLSPRLVLRRGVQALLAEDEAAGKSPVPAPALQRVDTVLGFERAMATGLVSPIEPVEGSSSGTNTIPVLSRITTLSGLPELADAEAALEGAEGASVTVTESSSGSSIATIAGASSRSTATTAAAAALSKLPAAGKAEPTQVRRIDTMELLTAGDLVDDVEEAAGPGPAKRVKAEA